MYKLYFHMKDKERTVGSASANVQVQPGLGAGPDGF
jgi:hypothetical protein